ncbi:hypothetical protein [Rothia nasimurium]|uniref:hypothetical protein n=1 Tax=Rothia nasimurium TaxID=85336 RepID=UPI001F2AFA24|nr:hypothetical protein [Rothia nasimurium]
MSGENWGALGGEQFKGDPHAFRALAAYWGDVSKAFDSIKKPETDAIGVTARNFDSALGEMESAFDKAKETAEALEKLCDRWSDRLHQLQDSAERLARRAGDAQESIDSCRRKLEKLNQGDKQSDDTVSRERRLREDFVDAESNLRVARYEFWKLNENYVQLERFFENSYIAPKFSTVSAHTTSRSSLGRRFAALVGEIEQEHPEWATALEFVRSMLPFEDDGSVKSSLFYNDLFFAHIGGIEKALSSFRLGLGPGSGAQKSIFLSKILGYDKDIYFPNPLKEKFKLTSGYIGSNLQKLDLEGAFKNALDANVKNLDDWAKSLVGNTDELAAGMAESVRKLFPKYSLPINAISKNLDHLGESKNIIASNAKILSESFEGKVGAFAQHLPMVGKLSKKIPAIGTAMSAVSNYSEYYDNDKHASSSEGEKRARAVGASVATTGSGFAAGAASGAALGAVLGSVVPGVGTAIGGVVGSIAGGIIGGWAGEEAAKKLNVDDGMADFFGNIYQGIKG